MGTDQRPVFLRPVQITDDNKNVRVNYSSTDYDIVLTTGTYASILTVLSKLNIEIDSAAAALAFTVSLDDDFVITFTGSATFTVTWTDTDMANLFGFTANLSGASSYTATYTPTHCWVPARVPANQSRWRLNTNESFIGAHSNSGRIGGAKVVDDYYTRVFDFLFEDATNLFKDAATASFTLTSAYYPEQDRCFENFILRCRSETAYSANAYPKGVYFFEKIANAQAVLTTMDAGGISFDLSSSPDTYVYCMPEVRGASIGEEALPVGRDYYHLPGFALRTCDAPTWDN